MSTILIVDDDERNIFALSSLLNRKGYEIETAMNGEICLKELACNLNIDLILMDIMMPVMDSFETISAIRKMEIYNHIPIVAVSAKNEEIDKSKCFELGAEGFISKPIIIIKDLLDMVEKILEIRSDDINNSVA